MYVYSALITVTGRVVVSGHAAANDLFIESTGGNSINSPVLDVYMVDGVIYVYSVSFEHRKFPAVPTPVLDAN